MDLKKIEVLLKKYYNGETSIGEEKLLHDFFNKYEVPDYLKPDQELFSYYSTAQKNEEIKDIDLEQKILQAIDQVEEKPEVNRKKRYLILTTGIAASIILFIGIYFLFTERSIFTTPVAEFKDTYDDPVLAYNETKKALLLISEKFNTGTDELQNISKINIVMKDLSKMAKLNEGIDKLSNISKLNKGIKELTKISKFNQVQELITKKN